MEFSTVLENFDSNLWGYHIVVPDEVSRFFLDRGSRRVVCTLNEAHEFQCALMPIGDGTFFININKSIREKLKLKLGSPVHARLRPDDSEYGLPLPEELKELLKLDEEGNRLFHALTPGKQRSLLHIIGSPKTSDTRLRKAIVVIEYLKSVGGKLNFRKLGEAFKEGR